MPQPVPAGARHLPVNSAIRVLPGIGAIAAVIALTGCGGGATHQATAASSQPSPPKVTASAAALSPAVIDGNITLSAQGRSLPPGPFVIKPVYCGRFTAAQQNQFGTTATGGLIYQYTNTSSTLTGAAVVQANVTEGSTVAGNNVAGAGNLSPVGPGQSATGEVDAVGGGGQNLVFTGCELMEYAVNTSSSGTLPVSYAP